MAVERFRRCRFERLIIVRLSNRPLLQSVGAPRLTRHQISLEKQTLNLKMSCLSKQNVRKKYRWVKSRQRKSFIVTKLNNWSWVWFSYFYRRSRGDAWQGQNQDLPINFYEHVPCRNNSKDQHQNEIGLSFAGWKGKFKVVWTFHILPSRCSLYRWYNPNAGFLIYIWKYLPALASIPC